MSHLVFVMAFDISNLICWRFYLIIVLCADICCLIFVKVQLKLRIPSSICMLCAFLNCFIIFSLYCSENIKTVFAFSWKGKNEFMVLYLIFYFNEVIIKVL